MILSAVMKEKKKLEFIHEHLSREKHPPLIYDPVLH